MIKVEKVETYGWEAAIRGMRNPMNSWDKSDSGMCPTGDIFGYCYGVKRPCCPRKGTDDPAYCIGKNDYELMSRLSSNTPDHEKFMRMIS